MVESSWPDEGDYKLNICTENMHFTISFKVYVRNIIYSMHLYTFLINTVYVWTKNLSNLSKINVHSGNIDQ